MSLFAKYLIFSQHRSYCPSSLLQTFRDPWLAVTLPCTTLVLIVDNFNISKDGPISPLSSHFLFLFSSELVFHSLTQSFPSVCVFSCSVVHDSLHPHGCSPPGSPLHGIFQERILEQVVISCSMGASQPSAVWEAKSFPWPYPKTLFFPITTTLSQSYPLTVNS